MNTATRIRPEATKRLSVPQELDLTRTAFARNPRSTLLRTRLAALQNQTDAFADTITLLDGVEDLGFGETMMLIQALLSVETVQASERARLVAGEAVVLADDDRQQAAALADMGKAMRRLGDSRARDTLVEALRLDPHNKNACKRLAALDLEANDPRSVVAMARTLAAQGVAHARLFAAHALALTRLGEIASARAVVGLDRFRCRQELSAPPGWANIAAFNAALADELLANPGLRYESYGTASDRTWRIDSLTAQSSPLARMLFGRIMDMVNGHVAAIASIDHPWANSRPEAATLHGWCVITDDPGFETWHVHQFGWLSGVYYVAVPGDVENGHDKKGCIAFGLPEDLAGSAAAETFGRELVRPRSGLAMLFPSHAYHRTFAHESTERRICVAFDVRPD